MGDAQVYGICLEDSGDQPSNLGVQYPLLSFAETNSKGKESVYSVKSAKWQFFIFVFHPCAFLSKWDDVITQYYPIDSS